MIAFSIDAFVVTMVVEKDVIDGLNTSGSSINAAFWLLRVHDCEETTSQILQAQ
jgi:hypothetical protein